MARSGPTIAIVGAGPAGSAAAHVTASHGLRTLLFDRAVHPREKVCGEGCSPRAVQNLRRMGLLDELETQGAPVSQTLIVSPGGVELFTDIPSSIFGGRLLVIPRATLDERLVQRAVRAGAALREGVRVERVSPHGHCVRLHLQDRSTVDVDAVIGCDGMPSVVRRSLGAQSFRNDQVGYAIRGIFENVELPHDRALTLIWERSVLPAYGWLFPLPGNRANVGIGLRMHQLKKSGRGLRDIFEAFLTLPRVESALSKAKLRGRALGHALPMTANPGEFVFDRALLAGDAAGFVNPLTGEGIEYALESGDLAGRVIVQAAQLGAFGRRELTPYAWACADQFGHILRLNALLRSVFAVPWMLDRIARAGNRSKAVSDDIARIVLGDDGAGFTARMAWAAIAG